MDPLGLPRLAQLQECLVFRTSLSKIRRGLANPDHGFTAGLEKCLQWPASREFKGRSFFIGCRQTP